MTVSPEQRSNADEAGDEGSWLMSSWLVPRDSAKTPPWNDDLYLGEGVYYRPSEPNVVYRPRSWYEDYS